MERKIRVAQYGCGKMSVYLMRYVLEKGGEIVAVFDISPKVIGKDIGEIMQTAPQNIIIKDAKEAEQVLAELKPDVCIVSTLSTLAEIKDIFTLCAKNKINAISTCEESLYPWNSSPTLTKELDEIAKQYGVTLSGSGYPDMYWGVLVATLAGSLHQINKIKGISSHNVEDYGMALAKGHGAGLSLEQFEKEIGAYNHLSPGQQKELVESGKYIPSYTCGIKTVGSASVWA